MLAFCIEYLSGHAYAADYQDRDRAEWPPHPARFFSALMAACYAADFQEPGLHALRWLEQQGPPAIAASEAHERQRTLVYVPINDPPTSTILPEVRPRQPRSFPCTIPEDPRVYLIWAEAVPEAATCTLLASMAAQVTSVWSARSLVAVTLCATPPLPSWIPAARGEQMLRIPAPGRVEELNTRFDLGLRPTPGLLHPYTRVRPASAPPIHASGFGAMLVLRQTAGPRLALTATLTVTETLRRAVLSLAGAAAPALLHGHDDHRHAAWAPLPFVGYPHADGHLLGTALLLPPDTSREAFHTVLQCLARLDHVRLPDGRRWALAPVDVTDRRATLQPATWVRASRTWTTVTPAVLPRYPKPHRGQDAAALLAASCHHSGLPVPAWVRTHQLGQLAGVAPSHTFRTRRPGHPPRLWTHATLHFPVPVQGPVLVGALRYFGLGLCRPLTALQEEPPDVA
jgi:CRISPR-associated protein Csb2